GNLVAGMVADIYLSGAGRDQVLSVPVGSVSEQQGVNFVYVKLDDDCYRKVPVLTGRNDGRRVEIKQGIEAGTPVVTEGMTFVKLAESNGAVPEGHSHNH
ncbi:MAG: efflux RND transporter periplasmic adaptor subunit, partial [Muribaculaceae bacterium]|nr:efflux RND transporter periplasmic adaptor subunit [Muribaculaceae bacterium]